MHLALICVSGYAGGREGPRGMYNLIGSISNKFHIHRVDIIPANLTENVQKIVSLVNEIKSIFSEIYLIGWSYGGIIVMESYFVLQKELEQKLRLNTKQSSFGGNAVAPYNPITGIILLESTSTGLFLINRIHVPVLAIYGNVYKKQEKKDNIEELKKNIVNTRNRLEIIEGDHGLFQDPHQSAFYVINSIINYFRINTNKYEEQKTNFISVSMDIDD